MADALTTLVADHLRRCHGVTDTAAVAALLEAVAAGHCRADLAPNRFAGAIGTVLAADGAGIALGRHARAEARLARRITALVARPPTDLTDDDGALVRARFPGAASALDHQAVAVVAALRHPLTVITGGPGTGKTTVAATVVEALLARQPDLAVLLATPTGKAAARLRESLATSRLPPDLAARLARRTATLHRHLGVRPDGSGLRHHAGNPLACDLLILDEVSMIDVDMLAAAFEALPPTARVVLLGDRHQLASVEAGYALGDLAAAARGEEYDDTVSPAFAAACRALGLIAPPQGTVPALADRVVTLRTSRRFHDDRGIGRWARAVKGGMVPTSAEAEVRRVSVTDLLAEAEAHGRRLVQAATPAAALTALTEFRLLTPIRNGRQGVIGLNRTLATRLGLEPGDPGTPILITANDAGTGLANGDVGIIGTVDGHRQAWFPGDDGTPRAVALRRLPPWEPAWAMTVHKSQGSEFATVGILLPETEGGLLVRELLYTALTRAKRQVLLSATDAVLTTCVAATAARRTGLVGLLRG